MTSMRAAVALLATLTLVTACGGSNVGAGPARSAGLLKPGAVVYWQTVSDPDSAQWEQAEDLLARFPDGDRWLAQLKQGLQDEGVTWEQDVEPALGPVVDVAVYGGGGTASPAVVALTNPEDKDKLLALVRRLNERSDEPVVSRVVGDWVAISDRDDSIDAALKGDGAALADDEDFEAAMAELPDDALSRGYADPGGLLRLSGKLGLFGLGGLDFAAGWAKAQADGVELELVLRGQGADNLLGDGEPYSSTLLRLVPSDAFAFVTFRGEGLKRSLEQLRANPLFAMALREYEREYGIDVEELASLLGGEVGLFAGPGPKPEYTLLVQTTDATALARLLRLVADDLTVSTRDGIVVVSTAHDPFGGSGAKLEDTPRFQAAVDRAGVPGEYKALAYVDLSRASRDLKPLQSLVAYGPAEGEGASLRVFVRID